MRTLLSPRKRLLWGLLLFSMIMAQAAPQARAQNENATHEKILDFACDIEINTNTMLVITEKITFFSAGKNIKRGLVRALPTTFNDGFGYTVTVRYKMVSAERDGAPEAFFLKKEGKWMHIYLGTDNAILPTGQHTYTLKYLVERKIQYFDTYDALFWDAIVNNMRLPVEHIKVTVTLPAFAEKILSKGYVGKNGKKDQDYEVEGDSGRVVTFRNLRPLSAGENFAVALSWPKGLVQEPNAKEYYQQ